MNLFNEFYKNILTEATSRLPKVPSQLDNLKGEKKPQGYRRQEIQDSESISKTVSILKPSDFVSLKKNLDQNIDVFDKALDMFNSIKGLSEEDLHSQVNLTKPESYNYLLLFTTSKFHDPNLMKNDDPELIKSRKNIQQFKAHILSELNDSKNKGEIDQEQFVKFFMNSDKWHKLYASILEQLKIVSLKGSEQEKENTARSQAQFKPLNKRDTSAKHGEKEETSDKPDIFYFDASGNPHKTFLIIPPSEFSSLQEKEDNVPIARSFWRGNRSFGKILPPPAIPTEDGDFKELKYEPIELRNKTVSEIKEILGHDDAKRAYASLLRSNPNTEEKFRKKSKF